MTPYPLAWPDTIPRFKSARQPGAFRATLAAAMKNVRDSLRLFGSDSGTKVEDVVISSNVTLGVSTPADPGVAIWFKWDGLSICIPVDRYSKVEANLQAIHHIIEARRVELRHGTLALVRATFAGFLALPTPKGSGWREVMKLPLEWVGTRSDVEARYRELAFKAHPDQGGNADAMAELNRARAQAHKELS